MGLSNHDDATIDYCKANGIGYESYGAMKNCQYESKVVAHVAEAHGVSAAQVCLRWVLQTVGLATVGLGTTSEERIANHARDNLAVFGFELSEGDMSLLRAGVKNECTHAQC